MYTTRNDVAVDVGGLSRRNHFTINENENENEHDRRHSLGQVTREALPRLDHFRLSKRAMKRPSLGELHDETHQKNVDDDDDPAAKQHSHFRLGWIQGVLIPVLLNIYGVMLFLRMGWIVAHSGIIESSIIVVISAVICVITTLSLSAISTNGEVKGGGIYYIISRSLGPEFGASVGVVFAFANAVAASMNTIGFCDSLNDLLSTHGLKIVDGGVNDTRIIGTIAIVIMIFICAVGMEYEVKAQNVLIVIIAAAILDFMIGTIIGPSSEELVAKGFTGFKLEVLEQNLYSDYRFSEGLDQTFFTVFAIFFPSVTGLQAGANICGDLKDPATAIPKGTLLALLISMSTYAAFLFFVGGAALRDASGVVADVANKSFPYNFPCAANLTCEYGLHNSYSVMQLMSVWGWLIYAGCFAATLSTALTNLLSVPRLIQALGLDRIFPGFYFFSKGYGKSGEPYRGYVLVLIVSVAFLLLADLNMIAPLISNFYLVAYALINFCTFHAAFVAPLGWRPTFKYYNKWLSLFCCILCIVIMFFLSWQSSLVTVAILFALYLIVMYRQPDANWGSSTQEQTYRTLISAALRLQHTGDHIKNYHPQILVLAGNPISRPALIDLGNLLTKNTSLLMVGDVVETRISHRVRTAMVAEAYRYFEEKKIKGFYNLCDDVDMETGIKMMIQSSGFGRLSPNIVLMGYKTDWATCEYSVLKSYFNVLHNALVYRVSIAILRMPNGLDFSYAIPQVQVNGTTNPAFERSSTDNLSVVSSKIMHVDSNMNLSAMNSSPDPSQPASLALRNPKAREKMLPKDIPKEMIDSMNFFHEKRPKGTIDVWWLYDDGGLTLLLPYIISTRATWANCKIRIFALSNRKQELEVEQKDMANLLAKLRINYSSLVLLQGVFDPPKEGTMRLHAKVLDGFLEGQNDQCFVSDVEREKLRDKTNLHLRLREMLREHSDKASLIVMSLPMPRQNEVSAPLYMSWLEMLTRGMPPFLLVRGNQTSVLTFDS